MATIHGSNWLWSIGVKMKVQVVNFAEFPNNEEAPTLSPPELAAAFARKSRTRDSLETIIESVSHVPAEKRADTILKFADYGHRSIMDMLIIPIDIHGVSMYAAARLLQAAKMAGAQESSTRYITDEFTLLTREETDPYLNYSSMEIDFDNWKREALLVSQKGTRQERNEVLDKIRYDLPLIATTSLGLTQSARGWAECITFLLSYPHEYQYDECGKLATFLQDVIKKTCGPYPVKHSGFNGVVNAKYYESDKRLLNLRETAKDIGKTVSVDISMINTFAEIGRYKRKNRYDPFPQLFDEAVCSVYLRLPFAELRDLNRHRNRVYNNWVLDQTCRPNLGTLGSMNYRCSLSQLLYEIEIRTSEGAHQSYRKIMNEVKRQVFDLLGDNMKSFLEDNLFDNQGQEAEG